MAPTPSSPGPSLPLQQQAGRPHEEHDLQLGAYSKGGWVRIESEIDWHEREKILKAAFPLDVHADRSAAEIQFGHVFRPTHTNTSWDMARFETACHRWVHLAEPDYGVALLNDSIYGHDVTRTTRPDGGTTTTVRLSLVRAPRSPDPEADQGRHRMTYTLLPGAAVAGGYALNMPLRVATGSSDAPPAPLVSIGGNTASIETVKLADDRSGDVIVRRTSRSAAGRTRACGPRSRWPPRRPRTCSNGHCPASPCRSTPRAGSPSRCVPSRS
ncbi:hypothetical protein GCM10023084_39580 [Streptomyces lacrimifluminis]|uniref:Glycosyl hydrolase family 38 C-terminal domain-containing protein n=1 Tax=Streptomyces lacrimifluminis TaxID=1500077 RepID=A0A917L4I2_9ACTN|nr:hypothetical protein GCM10012282_41200 [Streptomyces lacrimifluminis]